MQTASCYVRLLNSNGPSKHEVFKSPVTPPEVVLLRMVHGDDAVVNVKALGMDKREHRRELDRLRARYGAENVERAFPGHSPSLPVRFADIGIDLNADEDEAEAVPQPKRGRRAKAAEEVAGSDSSDGKYDPAIDGE